MTNAPDGGPDLIARARTEFMGMMREGKDHPSTVPVFAGAALGALAGAVFPVVSWPLGLAAGVGIAFYQRIRT